MKRLFGLILCVFGIHDWLITKWSRFKDIKCKHIFEEGFDRTCERCDTRQRLKRPTKYHPSKYIWVNIKDI